VAFGKNGEFIEKHLKKGVKIGLVGRIQTGSYTNKEGRKVYTTDVVVEETTFCEKKADGSAEGSSEAQEEGFMNIPDNIDDEVPFT
jgi:single-strand DNA-binding protein